MSARMRSASMCPSRSSPRPNSWRMSALASANAASRGSMSSRVSCISPSWTVRAIMRRRRVRCTAAKLEAAIFWKIVITNPSARPLLPRLLRQGKAVHQVDLKGVVELPLGIRHDERFGVDPAAGEQRRTIRAAGVGLGATEND